MPQNPIDDESTLAKVMARYRQNNEPYWVIKPKLSDI